MIVMGSSYIMTEKSPMLSTRVASSHNGSVDTEAAKNEDLPPPPRSSVFTPLNLVLCILSFVVMAVLIVGIMLLVQINQVRTDYEQRANALPAMIDKVGQKLKSEMQQMASNIHLPSGGLGPAGLGSITPEQIAQLNQMGGQGTLPQPVHANTYGPSQTAKDPATASSWRDEGCNNLGKCPKIGFEKPPLVVLSLDGFRRDYLERGILKSLDLMKECGATSDRVYPTYPSRTFPNHYTMATGLYPESHGIVANVIYDPTISPKVEDMKRTKINEFFKGNPIWSQYQDETGRPAACYFWVGCSFNMTTPPKYNLPYDGRVSFRDRIDQIIDWLLYPAETRPGLIMAYYDEPDNVGHFFTDDNKINDKLRNIEWDLDYFFSKLHEHGLLECINLMILSDHGMQENKKRVFMSDLINLDGLIGAKGVIGRIYKNGTKLTDEEIMEPFSCRAEKDLRVFPRSEVPIRKHYSKTAAIGEFILQGEAGTMFHATLDRSFYPLAGDHGYDYLMENMHTVFFARGPSIKKGTVLPPFQNIEYLNLFRDLLGLSSTTPNNGTAGVMDEMLVNPPRRDMPSRNLIRECPTGLAPPGAATCQDCPIDEKNRLSSRLFACSLDFIASLQKQPQLGSNRNICFQNFCEKSVILGADQDKSVAIWERLNKTSIHSGRSPCALSNTKYAAQKDCNQYDPTRQTTLSASKESEFSLALPAQIELPTGFIDTVLNNLNNLTLSYVDRFEDLFVLSGTTYDKNHDGVRDHDSNGNVTHFYRIIIRCGGQWNLDGSCDNEEKLEVFSFIFPVMEKDRNCLEKDQLLLEYSARLKDVELIAGFELRLPKISYKTMVRLKTHIHLKLW